MSEKMFPLQAPRRDGKVAPHPLQIPWSVAEKAYSVYAARYGRNQSLERLAARGGFGGCEMDELYPEWRDEVSEIESLKAQLTALTQRAEQADAFHAWLDKNNFGRHDDIALRIQELEEYVEKRRRNAWAFVQVANEAKTKLTAAKQRAEQRAEQAEREYDVLGHQHFELRRKLTAAEAEVKRLREGIEAHIKSCDSYGLGYCSPYAMQALGSDLRALLAHPSDGKEAEDGKLS